MANIRVDTSYVIVDGSEVVFTAPCNCNEISGLKVYYPGGSKEFAFMDAHGNILTGLGNLFSKGAFVKVILDVTNGYAYPVNADTNAYLEERLASAVRDISVGKLTESEKAVFSALDGNKWLNSKDIVLHDNLDGFAAWAYRNAGVDVFSYLGTVHTTFSKMFDTKSATSTGRKWKLLDETEDNRYQLAMLLPDSYGGGERMTGHGYEYNLAETDYKVGDIFCMRHSKTIDGETVDSCYYMALCTSADKDAGTCSFMLYEDYGDGVGLPHAVYDIGYFDLEEIIFGKYDYNTGDPISPIYYYVLRPENVAIADARYTDHKVQLKYDEGVAKFDAALKKKAPAGYGLGSVSDMKTLTSWSKLDAVTVSGWYRFTGSHKGISEWVIRIDATTKGLVQTWFGLNSEGAIITYRRACFNGVWQSDFLNPPCAHGTEYETAEVWNRKPVYTMLLNMGRTAASDPVNTGTVIAHKTARPGISYTNIIRCAGILGSEILPVKNFGGIDLAWVHMYGNTIDVCYDVEVYGADMYPEGVPIKVQIWYTK